MSDLSANVGVSQPSGEDVHRSLEIVAETTAAAAHAAGGVGNAGASGFASIWTHLGATGVMFFLFYMLLSSELERGRDDRAAFRQDLQALQVSATEGHKSAWRLSEAIEALRHDMRMRHNADTAEKPGN